MPLSGSALHEAKQLLATSDLLHVHGMWNYSNVQLAKLAARVQKPYVVSPHGMLDDWCMAQKSLKKRLFMFGLGKKYLESARAIHLTAEAELDQSRKWFPNGNGIVIPNLLDLQPFRQLPGPSLAREKFAAFATNEPVVLFLSRVHVKKGAEVLLQSASLLHKRGTAAQYIFAGAGDDTYIAQLRAQAFALGISDRVHFVGHVGGDLKISLYQASLCLALPTFQENFGFVFPEAMAASTPVITTKGVDIWAQLQRGGGIIVERDAKSFADSIESLVTKPSYRDELGMKGRKFVFQEYDESTILSQFEKMYGCREGKKSQQSPAV